MGASSCSFSSSANFNGTPIAAGSTLWFTIDVKANGLGSSPVTVYVTQAEVSFTASGTPYTIALPNFTITYSPQATAATVSYGAGGWTETIPSSFSGDALAGAGEYPVATNLPGKIQNVSMTANFNSSQSGVGLQWYWSSAVYSQFNTSYSALAVKPVDDNNLTQYQNSDRPGTPENYKPYLVAGAMGSGGTMYTGGVSGTSSATPCIQVAQNLFVANPASNTVTEYAPPYSGGPIATISSGTTPDALVMNAAGDLFISNGNSNTVTEYAPPYTGAPIATISNGISAPSSLVMDPAGDLFVGNTYGNSVLEFAPPYTGAPTTIITPVTAADSLALNAAGDLFVADIGGSPGSIGDGPYIVTEYAPPYTGAATTVSTGLESVALLLNASGDLFSANYGYGGSGTTVTEYAPPYTAGPANSISVNAPDSLALDASSDLFVGNATPGSTEVTEYAPPYTGAPSATITNGVNGPGSLAVDATGDLFVLNERSNTVTEYAPPYTGAPIATISGVGGYNVNTNQLLLLSNSGGS